MAIIPDLIIVDMKIAKGVLAGRHYNSGNKILELQGDLLAQEDLEAPPYMEPGVIQVGPGIFMRLAPSCAMRFMKHSCEPNAGLIFRSDGRVELTAIGHIPPMGEIVWDFCTTISSVEEDFDCACNKKSCRKKLGNYSKLPEPVRRRYEYMGIVAPYLAPATVIR